tara:strand:- start:949 stop:1788 length:840 start_codon:yes stop_codon:yes gene_type:complete
MPTKKSALNRFFKKIFVINLYDKTERWKKISKQFKNRNIQVERFIAVDGRCKNQGKNGCLAKLKTFEMIYDVKISNREGLPLKELVPASSLAIGTILLLRAQVKNKWKHMLICEDDIELTKNIEKKFKKGIKELPKDWDLLYLGCGRYCGNNGIGTKKTKNNKYDSQYNKIYPNNPKIYVEHPNDLRVPCDKEEGWICKSINDYLSEAEYPGGTWCYAYSLKGAQKMLKHFNNKINKHLDWAIGDLIFDGKIKAYAFNPPIVMHEGGVFRTDSDIPWKN